MKAFILATVTFLLASSSFAGESTIKLKEGPGREKVMSACIMCHSLDYIQMNSVFMDRKSWEATVNKMKKVMGAPVNDADAQVIIDYLVKNYGKEGPSQQTGDGGHTGE